MRRALLVQVVVLLALAGCGQSGSQAARGVSPPAGSGVVSPSGPPTTLDPCPVTGSTSGVDALPKLSFRCLIGPTPLILGQAPGVPTVLNLWAPWCGPCREELPLFDRLHDQAAEQVIVIGLVEKDTESSSVAFAAETGLSFPSGLDESGQLSTAEGLSGLPVTYFLRADGSIAHRRIGPITSYEELRELLSEHLGVAVPA